MIGCILTVDVRLKSDWTHLERDLGEEGGVYACNLGGGGQRARMGRGGTKKRRAYTRAGEDRDYKDKYASVTLAKEDYKAEEGGKKGVN